jgi:uncharacterized protein (TIGR03437 family)
MSWAQRLETAVFFADMLTENEVPPVTGVTATGTGTIGVHVTRNAQGAPTAAVVDFEVNFTHPATEFTGLHIHFAPAGTNGAVVIGTNLSGNNPVAHPGGAGRIFRQVTLTDPQALAVLGQALQQPEQFYVNIHSREFGGGVIRGQLARAEVLQLRTELSPLNEVPAILDQNASGAAAITAVAVRNRGGEITGGEVRFDINYSLPSAVNVTGLHIHNGPAGVNAGVVIGTDLSAANPIPNATSGRVIKWVSIRTPAQLAALRGLFTNPAGYYANLHTAVFGAGLIRGQLLNTGAIHFPLAMTTDQEVPAVTGLQASAVANVHIYPTRAQSGRVTSATVIFDANHQFPDTTEFTGFHIHRAAAGAAGGVVIDSGITGAASVTNPGIGNISRAINIDASNATALDAVNDLLANPGGFYLNLHTRTHGSGAVRAQLGAPPVAPAINANGIISAVQDAQIAAASPGSIISIYGTNLAGTTSDASGMEVPRLPTGLNGTDVRIGGRQAALFFVSPNQINAQVPYETQSGDTQVYVVRGGSAFSAPYALRVGQVSPGIFVTSLGAAVAKNADFSLVSASNPAAAGEVLSIFCTGLGAVTPAVASGLLAPAGPIALTLAQPTVTVGGRDAEVLASALAPGFVGLNQVAIRMPSGVPAGNQPVVITSGGVRSNAAPMAVR